MAIAQITSQVNPLLDTPRGGILGINPGRFERYTHKKRADGGHYRASFDLTYPLDRALEIFSSHLFNEIRAFNHRGIQVWEGFVFGMSLKLGGFQQSVSLENMANRMWARYYNGSTTVRSTTQGDADSQARYWIREEVLGLGEATLAQADQAVLTRLGQKSDPGDPAVDWSGPVRGKPTLSVQCRGYWDLLFWRVYNNPSGTGTSPAHLIVGDVLDDVAPWVLSRDIDKNYTAVDNKIDADRWAGDFIGSVVKLGNPQYDRFVAGVGNDRSFYYRQAALDALPL